MDKTQNGKRKWEIGKIMNRIEKKISRTVKKRGPITKILRPCLSAPTTVQLFWVVIYIFTLCFGL